MSPFNIASFMDLHKKRLVELSSMEAENYYLLVFEIIDDYMRYRVLPANTCRDMMIEWSMFYNSMKRRVTEMMKTDKYNDMIQSFECDFNLVLEGVKTLSDLQKQIENRNEKLLKDIELLRELSFLLRNGKAEIRALPVNTFSDMLT